MGTPHESGSHSSEERLARALRTLWPPLLAYTIRLLDDRAAAEDVVQRAFIRLWERHGALPPDEGLRPLLYRIVRNLALNELRRLRTRAAWLDDHGNDELAPPAAHTPEQAMQTRELESAIAAAVERLPTRRRETFVLSRYHHLSNAQIAEVLGVSPQTVANQLVSALRDLRTMLGPWLAPAAPPELRLVRDEKSSGPDSMTRRGAG